MIAVVPAPSPTTGLGPPAACNLTQLYTHTIQMGRSIYVVHKDILLLVLYSCTANTMCTDMPKMSPVHIKSTCKVNGNKVKRLEHGNKMESLCPFYKSQSCL